MSNQADGEEMKYENDKNLPSTILLQSLEKWSTKLERMIYNKTWSKWFLIKYDQGETDDLF